LSKYAFQRKQNTRSNQTVIMQSLWENLSGDVLGLLKFFCQEVKQRHSSTNYAECTKTKKKFFFWFPVKIRFQFGRTKAAQKQIFRLMGSLQIWGILFCWCVVLCETNTKCSSTSPEICSQTVQEDWATSWSDTILEIAELQKGQEYSDLSYSQISIICRTQLVLNF